MAGVEKVASFINLNNRGNDTVFDQRCRIHQGETVEFMVGTGNHSYVYDNTVLDATIELE